jgi:cobalamin synthase
MYGFAAYLKSKLGGLTGDSYGAVIEISEVIVLLLLCGKGVVFG